MYRALCVVSALLFALPLHSPQRMGPYEVEFRGFEICSDAKIDHPMVYNTRYTKVGRKKFTISFDLYAPHGLNDDFTAKVDFAIKTHNGFKHNFLNMEGSALQLMKNYSPQYYNLIKKIPVPPGNYSVRNLPVNFGSIPLIKSFFYNTYKAIINTYWKKERATCFEIIVEVVPTKKKT